MGNDEKIKRGIDIKMLKLSLEVITCQWVDIAVQNDGDKINYLLDKPHYSIIPVNYVYKTSEILKKRVHAKWGHYWIMAILVLVILTI